MTTPRRPHQGTLALVLIAGSLGACSDEPAETPVPVARASYQNLGECVQDWGSEADCEPQLSPATGPFNPSGMNEPGAASAPAGSSTHSGIVSGGGSSHGGLHGGSTVRWLGPFFTRGGTVYRYDGQVQTGQPLPSRGQWLDAQARTPAQIYQDTPGRYASTPAHAQASPAKSARGRGGFGSIGRGLSGGG